MGRKPLVCSWRKPWLVVCWETRCFRGKNGDGLRGGGVAKRGAQRSVDLWGRRGERCKQRFLGERVLFIFTRWGGGGGI